MTVSAAAVVRLRYALWTRGLRQQTFFFSTFSIFLAFFDQIISFNFFVDWLFTNRFWRSIKNPRRFCRASNKSAAICSESVSSSLLKKRNFIWYETEKFTKLEFATEILRMKNFLTDSSAGHVNRKCSSDSIFRKLQILHILESRSRPECLPFSSSMSNVPSLKFAIALLRFLPCMSVRYLEIFWVSATFLKR